MGAAQDASAGAGSLDPAAASLVERYRSPDEARCVVLTRTRADVGDWWGGRRIRLCCFDDGVVLAAPGPDPLVAWCPRGELTETIYNHVTGDLVLAPADSLATRCLRMGPLEAEAVRRALAIPQDEPEEGDGHA